MFSSRGPHKTAELWNNMFVFKFMKITHRVFTLTTENTLICAKIMQSHTAHQTLSSLHLKAWVIPASYRAVIENLFLILFQRLLPLRTVCLHSDRTLHFSTHRGRRKPDIHSLCQQCSVKKRSVSYPEESGGYRCWCRQNWTSTRETTTNHD